MTKAVSPGFIGFVLVLWINGAGAGDYERRVVTGLVENRAAGETVWLKANGDEFLALFSMAAGGDGEKAAIILHSMGTHADWPEIISPLRSALPRRGWSTLSLQLPVLPPGTPLGEYGGTLTKAGTRVQSGVAYLLERGYSGVVIIGYSFGAAAAVTYLAKNPAAVKAFAGISMQSRPFLNPGFDLLGHLAQLRLPVLDIYGGRDYAEVYRTADDRRLAGGRNGNRFYEQVVINGADHYYTEQESELINRITGWLDKLMLVNESTPE